MTTFTVNTGLSPEIIPANTDFTMKELINWRGLSEQLTGNADTIRSNRVPKKYEAAVQELDDLLEYWKKRNNIK